MRAQRRAGRTGLACLAALAALAMAVVAGCSGSSGPGQVAQPTPSVVAPQPTPSGPDIPANHEDFGYVKGIGLQGSQDYLVFDRAIFYTGADANAQAAAHHDETPVPNDYYIVNDNPLLRTYPVSSDVVILASAGLSPSPWDGKTHHLTFNEYLRRFAAHPHRVKAVPMHIHFDEHDQVDRITEQFVP